MRRRGLSATGWATASVLALLILVGCVSRGETLGDHLLEMEPGMRGYTLGSYFSSEDPKNAPFSYRGSQAGHRVYHRALSAGREQFSDILLHVDSRGAVNKIVLLKQFDSPEAADRFYERRYREQNRRYLLTADSGNAGSIRYARVEAYPTPARWKVEREEYRERGGNAPFPYYHHPVIAGRTASYAVVGGTPTVTLIYESHGHKESSP